MVLPWFHEDFNMLLEETLGDGFAPGRCFKKLLMEYLGDLQDLPSGKLT